MQRDLELTAPPIGSWSYSRLKNFESCPYQAYLRYGERRPEPSSIDRSHAERGIAVHTDAENYVKGVIQELPASLKKVSSQMEMIKAAYEGGRVSVEEEWGFSSDWTPTGWMSADCWVRIKLDAFIRDDTVGEAIDYKTGKKFGNEIAHAGQGQLYMLAGFVKYPEIDKIRTRFIYTDHGQEVTREYTRDQIPKLLKHWHDRGIKMTEALIFPAKPNKVNCRFCPYSPNGGGDRSCAWGVEL